MTSDSLPEVIALLTAPTFEHVAQNHDGHWRPVTAEVPPLLVLMRDAVLPSSNRDTGSASSAATRSIADFEAMMHYGRMVAAASDWVFRAGVVPTRDPVIDLPAWHDRVRANLGDDERDWYRRHLSGWVGIIRTHLEPPERFVIEHACPVCRTASYGDAINGGDRYPIEVRYRLNESGGMVDEIATCRAPNCGTRWNGHESVMELADELNEKGDAA